MDLPISDESRSSSTHDEIVHRRAAALVQHQRVMEEAAEIARIAAQARRRAEASPVFATAKQYPASIRARVNWNLAS